MVQWWNICLACMRRGFSLQHSSQNNCLPRLALDGVILFLNSLQVTAPLPLDMPLYGVLVALEHCQGSATQTDTELLVYKLQWSLPALPATLRTCGSSQLFLPCPLPSTTPSQVLGFCSLFPWPDPHNRFSFWWVAPLFISFPASLLMGQFSLMGLFCLFSPLYR